MAPKPAAAPSTGRPRPAPGGSDLESRPSRSRTPREGEATDNDEEEEDHLTTDQMLRGMFKSINKLVAESASNKKTIMEVKRSADTAAHLAAQVSERQEAAEVRLAALEERMSSLSAAPVSAAPSEAGFSTAGLSGLSGNRPDAGSGGSRSPAAAPSNVVPQKIIFSGFAKLPEEELKKRVDGFLANTPLEIRSLVARVYSDSLISSRAFAHLKATTTQDDVWRVIKSVKDNNTEFEKDSIEGYWCAPAKSSHKIVVDAKLRQFTTLVAGLTTFKDGETPKVDGQRGELSCPRRVPRLREFLSVLRIWRSGSTFWPNRGSPERPLCRASRMPKRKGSGGNTPLWTPFFALLPCPVPASGFSLGETRNLSLRDPRGNAGPRLSSDRPCITGIDNAYGAGICYSFNCQGLAQGDVPGLFNFWSKFQWELISPPGSKRRKVPPRQRNIARHYGHLQHHGWGAPQPGLAASLGGHRRRNLVKSVVSYGRYKR